MELVNLAYKQETLINDYGMTDPRYKISYNELTATFCVRSFKNMMPMILEIVEKMQKDYYKEGTICLSHAPSDLFRFISELFNSYKTAPFPIVSNAILGLVFK